MKLVQKARTDAETLISSIVAFVENCKTPVVLEKGEAPFLLRTGGYRLETINSWPVLEVWDGDRLLRRKLAREVRSETRRLEVESEQLGKPHGKLIFLDAAAPEGISLLQRGEHWEFREQFRWMLARLYPDWKVASISIEPDLERTLSPHVARAVLQRDRRFLVAVGATEGHGWEAIATGLTWLDLVQERCGAGSDDQPLVLLLEQVDWALIGGMLRLLNGRRVRFQCWEHDRHSAQQLALDDIENAASKVELYLDWKQRVDPELLEVLRSLEGLNRVDLVPHPTGEVSLRVDATEFAKTENGKLTFGIGESHEWTSSATGYLVKLAEQLVARKPEKRYGSGHPEKWLESKVRREIGVVEPLLTGRPLVAQLISSVSRGAGIVDLTGLTADGRLMILELKATVDPLLPLQALSYWASMVRHLERGDFAGKGYFAGAPIANTPPKLLLVAPAMAFHSTTELLVSHFSKEIEAVRVGLGANWQQELRVMFRLKRAARPDEW